MLAKLGTQGESYLHRDSNATMLKMRMIGEKIIDYILVMYKVEAGKFATQDDKIKLLRTTGINKAIPDLFDIVGRFGNKANHDGYENKKDALECLVSIYKISAWFYIRIIKDTSIKPLTYKIPKPKTAGNKSYSVQTYIEEKEKIKEEHIKQVKHVRG